MPISQQIGSSSLAKPGVCTSTTRPASPYEGQMIYETDTDRILVWNGSAWYANWNLPWGVVARAQRTSNFVAGTGEVVSITSSSFIAVTNRLYKIIYFENALGVTAGAGNYTLMRVRLTNATGTQYGQSQSQESGTTGVSMGITLVTYTTLSAGSTTIVGTIQANTGNPTTFAGSVNPAILLVEDIGPA